jgi:hypothetical protein
MNIQPFENLDITKYAINHGLANQGEIKFIKPRNPSLWNSHYRQCVLAAKILISFNSNYRREDKNFNIKYITKIFYNETTFNISYDPNQYSFIILTGYSFINSMTEITDQGVSFSSHTSKYLIELNNLMYRELPLNVYEKIKKDCELLAQAKTY